MKNVDLIDRIKDRAVSGDISAQYYLSVVYEDGRYGERDLNEAARWCEQAARAGDRQAQYRLSKMLQSGRGFDKSHLRAAWFWLEKAAQSGHIEARYELGVRFLFGAYGVRKSLRKAHTWLLASAHAYHSEANYYLGFVYLNGCGVKEDAEQAFNYLSRAVELGSLRAKCSLAFMLENGVACEVDHLRSHELYESAADCGHVGAQMYLATQALLLADYDTAIERLEQAANANCVEAQALLARVLSSGPIEIQDRPSALFWCLIALQIETEGCDESIKPFKTYLDALAGTATKHELNLASQKISFWLLERSESENTLQMHETGGTTL